MDDVPTKAYALDIFQVLERINANDFGYFATLEEHEQKTLAPYVLMKWMYGSNKPKHLLRLNNRANQYIFSLGKHKQLLYMLLCAVSDGRAQRYSWAKSATVKKGSSSLSVKVVQDYYGYSSKQAAEALPLLTKDDILDMAQFLGRQSDELTKLKSELKTKTTKAAGG